MKIIKSAFYFSLGCGALLSLAQAQDTPSTPPPTAGSPPPFLLTNPPPGMTNRPPMMMRDRTEILARMLNLTPEQKDKVRPIVEEETKQMDAIRLKTQEKLKPILNEEQYNRFVRFGNPGMGGPGMMMPPRNGPGAPPNVQVSPPPGATPTTPAK